MTRARMPGITDAMVDQLTLRKLLERRERKKHLAPRPKAKRNVRRRSRAAATKGPG